MRVHLLDSGLSTCVGHHYQSVKALAGAFQTLGHDVSLYAHQTVTPEIQMELLAKPHFRWHTYSQNTGDPISGWLEAFLIGARLTAEDLIAAKIGRDDLVYFNSAQPAQLYGVVQWLGMLADSGFNTNLQVVTEMGTDPGLDITRPQGDAMQFGVRNPQEDARATLYHFASRQMNAFAAERLHPVTFDKVSSYAYAAILQRFVGTLPVPRERITPPRDRASKEMLTVGIVGHGRGEKGYHLIPEIVERALKECPNVRFYLHNAAPEQMPELWEKVRELGRQNARVTVDERCADDQAWAEILDACDLLLLPYDPQRFAASYSAVACEAIANGIPFVCPQETTMSRMGSEYGDGFSAYGPYETIALWLKWIVSNKTLVFDVLASKATLGAAKWAETQGPLRTAEGILQLAGKP